MTFKDVVVAVAVAVDVDADFVVDADVVVVVLQPTPIDPFSCSFILLNLDCLFMTIVFSLQCYMGQVTVCCNKQGVLILKIIRGTLKKFQILLL